LNRGSKREKTRNGFLWRGNPALKEGGGEAARAKGEMVRRYYRVGADEKRGRFVDWGNVRSHGKGVTWRRSFFNSRLGSEKGGATRYSTKKKIIILKGGSDRGANNFSLSQWEWKGVRWLICSGIFYQGKGKGYVATRGIRVFKVHPPKRQG